MTRSNISGTSFLFIAATAGGLAATGCVDSLEPITGEVAHQLVEHSGPSPVAPFAELRLEGDRASFTTPGWAEAAPGIWTGATQHGVGSVIIGAEGHRSAIARGQEDLAALRTSGGSKQAIEQQVAYLDNLEASLGRIGTQPTPQVTCSFGFVFGPSSPLVGFSGAFAGVQLSCIDGTQAFVVQAQACTNFGCGPVATFFPVIGPLPQLFGAATGGTPGAPCSGAAAVSPPGAFASAAGPCG